jgi:hypothetical protein
MVYGMGLERLVCIFWELSVAWSIGGVVDGMPSEHMGHAAFELMRGREPAMEHGIPIVIMR